MTRNFRLVGVYVALAAMVLRALLPSGWMPNVASTGGKVLTICTVEGRVQVRLGQDGNLHKSKPVEDDSRRHELCPFAAAPQLAALSGLAALAPQPVVAAYLERRSSVAQRTDLRHHSPQAPRAPPILA